MPPCNNRLQDFRCNSPMTCEKVGRCPYEAREGDPGDPRWERVAEGKLEECAPGIYIVGAKAMDPTTRTALLYALGGPPYASRSARVV